METNESKSKEAEAIRLAGVSQKPGTERELDQDAALKHYDDLRKRLYVINSKLSKTTGEWPINEAIADFVEQMKAKYKVDDYHMFHLLGGSTLEGSAPYFDFPGQDSVAKFLDELAEKYLGEEELSRDEAV